MYQSALLDGQVQAIKLRNVELYAQDDLAFLPVEVLEVKPRFRDGLLSVGTPLSLDLCAIQVELNTSLLTTEALAESLAEALQSYWEDPEKLSRLTEYSWWVDAIDSIQTSQN